MTIFQLIKTSCIDHARIIFKDELPINIERAEILEDGPNEWSDIVKLWSIDVIENELIVKIWA